MKHLMFGNVVLVLLLVGGGRGAFGQFTAPPPVAPATPTANTAAIPRYVTRQAAFSIPFSVDAQAGQPLEVQLFVSRDGGATWQLGGRQQPQATQFTYRASGDGDYWFASRTVQVSGPPSSRQPLQPELHIVVDSVAPELEFSARAGQPGESIVSWHASDPNLLASSLRIEYQNGPAEAWQLISLNPPADADTRTSWRGEQACQPTARSPVLQLRAEVQDRAGNRTVVNRRLLLPAAQPAPPKTPRSFAGPPLARQASGSGGIVWPRDNAPPADPYQRPSAPSNPNPGQGAGDSWSTAASNQLPAQVVGASRGVARLPVPDARPGLDGPSISPVSSERGGLVSAAGQLPPGERPQMTNSPHFQLDYDVDSIGASGVAEVQLWATEDGGQTWRLWGRDEDRQSPFDVKVEREGIYGFCVVVVSNSGLIGPRPQAGAPADIWVGIDTTPPQAHLTGARYGENQRAGRLIIQWQAEDAGLERRPVSLLFSASVDGPWTPIATALPNDGEYEWVADPQLPPSVYLRLEVRDLAGNIAVEQTEEPIRIDGLAPKARIRSLMRNPEPTDREAFRPPDRR